MRVSIKQMVIRYIGLSQSALSVYSSFGYRGLVFGLYDCRQLCFSRPYRLELQRCRKVQPYIIPQSIAFHVLMLTM